MFIGRREELALLENKYRSPGGQLVVLYGRRRIGKTELLRQFCMGKPHVFYSCTECADSSQLAAFSERILRAGHPAGRYIASFPDWTQALSALADLPGEGKKLLVIDEFPYMVHGNAQIPSILQKMWDGPMKQANVMLVLCGSAMSFIEKEILSEKNPLYGRASCILRLEEMDYYDAAQFFPAYDAADRIRAYAVLGGVPHYLMQFSDERSLGKNIIEHILTRGSVLYNEVEFLMRQEFRESAVYNTILTAIALGATQLNEIWQKTQIEKSKLSAYLRNLMDVGLVQREFSMNDRLKQQGNVQRGLYRLNDPFFRFWYAYVFPYVSELDAGDAAGIYEHAIAPSLDEFAAPAFEGVCIQFLRRMNRAGKLPFHFTQIGRWWTKEEELDVVAVDAMRKHYLVGECKFRRTPLGHRDVQRAMEKFTSPEGADVAWCFFSRSGFETGLTLSKDVLLFRIEEMF